MEHPSLLAAHQLQFFLPCLQGWPHAFLVTAQHQSHIFWILQAHSVAYQIFSTTDPSEHDTHLFLARSHVAHLAREIRHISFLQ